MKYSVEESRDGRRIRIIDLSLPQEKLSRVRAELTIQESRDLALALDQSALHLMNREDESPQKPDEAG